MKKKEGKDDSEKQAVIAEKEQKFLRTTFAMENSKLWRKWLKVT